MSSSHGAGSNPETDDESTMKIRAAIVVDVLDELRSELHGPVRSQPSSWRGRTLTDGLVRASRNSDGDST